MPSSQPDQDKAATFSSPLVVKIGRSVDDKIQAAKMLALVAAHPQESTDLEFLASQMGMTRHGVCDLMESDEFRAAVDGVLRLRMRTTLGLVHDAMVEMIVTHRGGTTQTSTRAVLGAAKILVDLDRSLQERQSSASIDGRKELLVQGLLDALKDYKSDKTHDQDLDKEAS